MPIKPLVKIFPALFILMIGCAKDDIQSPPPQIDQTNNGFETFEVAKIFVENCAEAGCHSGSNAQHGLNLSSHSEMLKGSNGRHLDSTNHHMFKTNHITGYGGEAVIPYQAEQSLMYKLITGNIENQNQRMPYQRAPLSDSQIEVIKSWINSGAKDYLGNVPFSGASNNVYICNQGSDQIFVINTEYNVVSRIIDVDYNPTGTDAPHNVQLHGNYLYVSLISTGRFLKINTGTNEIAGYVDGIERAGMINISQDGRRAYVSRSSTSPGIYNTIYAVDTESMKMVGEINIPVTGVPHAIALTRNGSRLYIANLIKDRISIVDANTLELSEDDIVLSSTGTLVYEPMHIYLSPDDKYLYVNCRTSSTMLVISTDTKDIIQEIPLENHPMQSAISADGSKIYTVSHHHPVVTEITKSGSTWEVTNRFEHEAFHHLYGADLSPDGKYLYVTCSNQTGEFKPHYSTPGKDRPSLLCVFDVTKNEVVKIVDIGSYATGIASRSFH